MCIAAWVWLAHPLYPLILLLNRDELHDRPTKPVGWWGWGRKILGGRDIQAGGTWMGCTRDGRLAFLTNVMEPDLIPMAKTRGDLPVRFLESGKSPSEFAAEVAGEAEQYNGFNLILADLCSETMVYVSNRPRGEAVPVKMVPPGLHVLTNARLDTPWPKAQRLGQKLKEMLYENGGGDDEIPAKEMVEQLMADRVRASRDGLPKTGCDSDWEHKLSSIFVDIETELGRYGTRSQATMLVKWNGEASLYEKYLEDSKWKEHTVEFQVQKLPPLLKDLSALDSNSRHRCLDHLRS